ncbi:MAG: efflux RND transporter periplasmic adaptor subunit, partial [Phocaeicola sp.]
KHIPGSFVQKGEIIAKIQNPEFIALQQSYLEADAQSAFLELEYKRQQNLLTEEATSQKRLQESRSEYLTIKSKKEAAEVHLRILGVDAKELATKGIDAELVIHAPRSGYLSELSINQGKYVEAGEAICQIIDKSELLLQLTAYEKDLARVEVGQTLSFRANGVTDKNYKAIVSTIGQYVDPVTRAVQVYAKVNGANINFKPGMYVVAELAEN